MTYTTINHPRSGEAYAVEMDEAGRIIRAAGPLRLTEDGITDDDGVLMTPDTIADLLANQPSDNAKADAEWLRDALEA